METGGSDPNRVPRLVEIRNRLSFWLRAKLAFALDRDPTRPPPAGDVRLQSELEELFALFDWEGRVRPGPLTVLDVGARIFAAAPVLDSLFRKLGGDPTVHGIEIDAQRRLADLRTRADWGRYYARRIPKGQYHAADFLDVNIQADAIFLMNPFVTPRPLQSWGLPLRYLAPQRLFSHARNLLSPDGIFFFSSPSLPEFELASRLADQAGFHPLELRAWQPGPGTIQTQPRIAALCRLA